MILTEKLDSLDLQTSAEAAHICVQESKRLHSSLNTWPSKTLKEHMKLSTTRSWKRKKKKKKLFHIPSHIFIEKNNADQRICNHIHCKVIHAKKKKTSEDITISYFQLRGILFLLSRHIER